MLVHVALPVFWRTRTCVAGAASGARSVRSRGRRGRVRPPVPRPRDAANGLRVLALVPYPLEQAPGQRYRLEQWAPYLREQGIAVDFAPFADDALARILYQPGKGLIKAIAMLRQLMRRFPVAWRARGYDLVFVQREASLIGPAWAERLVHARRCSIVYDFDDAVYLPYRSPTNRHYSL